MKNDNIEDIYSELKTFSKEPPKELWDNIEARLHPKKKRRGILWFWGSAAAILLLLLGYVLTDSAIDDNQPIDKVSDIEHFEEDTNSGLDSNNTKSTDGIVTNETDKNDLKESIGNENIHLDKNVSQDQLSDRSHTTKQKNQEENVIIDASNRSINDKQGKPESKLNEDYAQRLDEEVQRDRNDQEIITEKNKSIINTDPKKDAVVAAIDSISKVEEKPLTDLSETLLAENAREEDSLGNNVAEVSKWSFEVLGGLSNTTSESTIQNTKVNTTPQNDFVYTFKVAYAISDRLVVKSGVGKNVLGQEIDNIRYASSGDEVFAETHQGIVSNESISFFASPELATDGSLSNDNFNEGNLQQRFDYIQIPLEVSYKLLANKRYNVSLGIGGNINFITANRAFLDDDEIGENLDANSTVLGAALNTNMSYELTEKWILFIEPSYNYFQKPIDNNNQSFSNSQLRFLFGLRFRL